MPAYRFLLTDLMSNFAKVVSDGAALKLKSYTRRLSNVGSCSATFDLSDPVLRELSDPVAATEPRRIALWIIRDGTVVWGGIIWTRRYRSDEQSFDLDIDTFESYLARRRIRSDLIYTGVDQHAILRNLVLSAMGVPYGGLPTLVAPALPASGITRDRSYYWYERATYLDRMMELSQVINGPDFTLEPGWGPAGYPITSLRAATPMGATLTTLVEYPGDIRNYSWPDDGGHSANYWSAIGDKPPGSADTVPPIIRDAQVSAEWYAGVPLLEDVSKHSQVTDPTTLQGYANANVFAASGNRIVPEATLRMVGQPLPALGDSVTLRITDPNRWPADAYTGAPGLIARVRITGWTVNLSEDGDETLTATLSEVLP